MNVVTPMRLAMIVPLLCATLGVAHGQERTYIDKYGHDCIRNTKNERTELPFENRTYVKYEIGFANGCNYSITVVLTTGSGSTQYLDVPPNRSSTTFCTDRLPENPNCQGFRRQYQYQ